MKKYIYICYWFILFLSFFVINVKANTCEQMTLLCTYNPQPAADDFSLPMPAKLEMVFKKVFVPGSEFWGNSRRLIKIGDVRGDFNDDDMFEGVQRLPIAGSFYDPETKNWYYFLGKYEVTIAQFIMVMGNGDHQKGLTHFYKISGDKNLNAELQKAMQEQKEQRFLRLIAQPLAWVSWYDFQDFMRQYNQWCFNTPACLEKLPRLPERLEPNTPFIPSDLPGFFRLPTELEWEYAARGGQAAREIVLDGRPLFENSLPFERHLLKDFAWVKPESVGKSPTRIGRWQATFGFYDLFGNVQELTADMFNAEIIQGKVGGLTARGGSFNDEGERIRASLRRELGIFQRDQAGNLVEVRSPTTGIRLAIGSLVVQSPRFREDLKSEYEMYADATVGLRQETPAGQSGDSGLMQADTDLQAAYDILDGLKDNQAVQSQLEGIKRALNQASRKLEQGRSHVTDKLTKNAVIILKTAGWHYARAEKRKELIEKIKGMDIEGRTKQIQSAQQTYEEHLDNYNKNFLQYVETVEELGGYPMRLIEPVFKAMRADKAADNLVLESLSVLQKHVELAQAGKLNVDDWKADVEKMALKQGLFIN